MPEAVELVWHLSVSYFDQEVDDKGHRPTLLLI
jgi:hypothetical protein